MIAFVAFTDGAQAVIVPPSPSKMKRAGAVTVPLLIMKSVVLALATMPVAPGSPFVPDGIVTTSACLRPVPS